MEGQIFKNLNTEGDLNDSLKGSNSLHNRVLFFKFHQLVLEIQKTYFLQTIFLHQLR